MKLWVDDLRPPPDATWTWAQTLSGALWCLKVWRETWGSPQGLTIALDHDLGGDDTTRPIVLWLIENGAQPYIDRVSVHTANPVGREWLEGMVGRFLWPSPSAL